MIIPLIGEIVKAASLLSAIADLNVDVMGKMRTKYEREVEYCKDVCDMLI